MMIAGGFNMAGYYDQPKLSEGLEFYLNAFSDLAADRSEALSSIPFSSIDRYATRYGLESDDFERFKMLVRMLDGAYLNHMGRKMKAQENRR
jgi:hypothetical protein